MRALPAQASSPPLAATASRDLTSRIFAPEPGCSGSQNWAPVATFSGATRYVNSVLLTRPRPALGMPAQLITGSLDGVVRAYALSLDDPVDDSILGGNKSDRPAQQLVDHWDNVTALDVHAESLPIPGQHATAPHERVRLASASWDASVRLYTWSPLSSRDTPVDRPTRINPGEEGEKEEKGEEGEGGEWTSLFMLRGHTSAVWTVKLLDGQRTLTACADMRVRLFVEDAMTKQFLAHDDVVRTLAVWPRSSGSPDSAREERQGCHHLSASAGDDEDASGLSFASSGNDGRILIWDLDKGQADAADGNHDANHHRLGISNNRPFTSEADNVDKADEAEQQQEEEEERKAGGQGLPGVPALERVLLGHESTVYDLALLPAADDAPPRLASASEDGTVRVWSVETGQQLDVLPHKTTTVWSVAAVPPAGPGAAAALVTACSDGHLCVWLDRRGPETPNPAPTPDLAAWRDHARAHPPP